MAGRGTIQTQCNKLNRERRVVTRSHVNLSNFWKSARGSFVIEGGSEETRTLALVTKLGLEMSCQTGASIVLTSSRYVEDALISLVTQSGVGFLQVCSPRYPRYDYFYGWDDAEIAGYLVSVAQERNLADQALVQLIAAFVSVLKLCYRPSLGSMRALADYDFSQIADLGEARGAKQYHVNTLRTAAPASASALRFLLDWLHQALPSATTDEETRENFSTANLMSNETYIVNISSAEPSAANAYFAHEIDRAVRSGMVARVILADIPLTAAGPLVNALVGAQMRNCEVGFSLVNASRMLQIAQSDLGALTFGARALLLDSAALTAGDLSVALQPLGTYLYHYPVRSTPGFVLMDPLGSKDEWSIATQERLRVRPEDTAGYAGVFYGDDGLDVTLAREYR